VGGTGRSGTTVTGALIGAHPSRLLIRQEAKFHAAVGGLCDLVEGRTTLARFENLLANRWFDRGPNKGVHTFLKWDDIEAALVELRRSYRGDPYGAAASFTYRLLDPLAAAAGAPGWVEMTPTNASAGLALLRLFPDMRLIHMVRDGRDVACSVVRQAWGPNDPVKALDWWARRLERAFRATEKVPPDRVLYIQLEDLIARDRERQYRRLLAFLDLDDDPAMRAFFENRMHPDRAHLGRWRGDVPPDRLPAFEARYEALAATFAARHWPYHPEGSPQEPSAVS
jgi:hypothetical protein